MDLINQLVEFVGFDILFLGFITLLTWSIAKELWSNLLSREFLGNCASGFRELFPPDGSLLKGGSVVLAAALIGMTVNLTADELLEGKGVISFGSLEWLKKEDNCKKEKGLARKGDCKNEKGIQTEDDYKEEALRDSLFLAMTPEHRQVLANQLELDGTKAFFQHAYAATLKSSPPPVQSMLRYEFLVVKTLRVLWLNVMGLTFVSLLAGIRLNWKTWQQKWKQKSVLPVNEEIRWILTVTISLLASYGLLTLWAEQSKRYYKKLLHSYLVVAVADDKLVARTRAVPEYPTLREIPGLKAYREAIDQEEPNGETNMFEFSSAESVAGKLIVADNETGKLRSKLDGAEDRQELALFEVKPKTGEELGLSRLGAQAFAGLTKKDYDDIEALAVRGQFLYMMGSHSKSKSGRVRKERQVLVRVQLDQKGEVVGRPVVFRGLMDNLVRHHADLGLVPEDDPSGKVIHGLNIEGLACLPNTGDVLLGLRSPLVAQLGENGQHHFYAIVLRLHDVDKLFRPSPPDARISLYALLDLGGRGISSLNYDPLQQAFLVGATSPKEDGQEANTPSSLFQWRPPYTRGENVVEIMRFPGHKLEGAARMEGNPQWKDRLLLAFDEEKSRINAKGEEVSSQFGQLVIVEWNPPSSTPSPKKD